MPEDKFEHVDTSCFLIHHMSNSYANDPKSKFGKIKIKDLII
jgi:hypothetical protein